jgi:hypothetical protein
LSRKLRVGPSIKPRSSSRSQRVDDGLRDRNADEARRREGIHGRMQGRRHGSPARRRDIDMRVDSE